MVSINAVGLKRRPNLKVKDLHEVKEAFKITYLSGIKLREALERMNQETGWGKAATSFRDFIGRVLSAEPPYTRGLCTHLSRSGQRAN